MSEKTVLITGTSRGIGLEFVRQYAAEGWKVIACCRSPETADALMQLTDKYSNIQTYSLDVGEFDQIDTLSRQLNDVSIDVLINNAGIYPRSSLGHTDPDAWLDAYRVNSMAPLKMVEAFSPHVERSKLKKVATLSSKMGSIDDNNSGGSYIYRSTKSAINIIMKSLSIDLAASGIAVLTLHPGWVATDMGGPNSLINTQTSVKGMRQVIDDLKLAGTGKFIAYDGKEIAW